MVLSHANAPSQKRRVTDRVWNSPEQKLMKDMTADDWKSFEENLKLQAAKERWARISVEVTAVLEEGLRIEERHVNEEKE